MYSVFILESVLCTLIHLVDIIIIKISPLDAIQPLFLAFFLTSFAVYLLFYIKKGIEDSLMSLQE